jgi:hypothetical protein
MVLWKLLLRGDSRHLQNKIGKPVGGIKAAYRFRRHRHGGEPLRRCRKSCNLESEPLRRECILAKPQRPAGALKHPGIGKLILIKGVR